MEELQQLAMVQATIRLLTWHSLSSDHASNDLFLAKFLLFAAQNCKDADDVSRKCSFLSSKLQQISSSSTLLQDLFNEQPKALYNENKVIGSKNPMLIKVSKGGSSVQDFMNDEAVSITLRDLERAKSTLEDFCRSYFMFHDMSVQNACDIFKHLPILAFVESYIYQIDEQKEERLLSSNYATSQQMHDVSSFQFGGVASKASTEAEENCFKPLQRILAGKNIWTTRIEEELQTGLEYWSLEQSLCSSVLMKEQGVVLDQAMIRMLYFHIGQILLSDVMRAIKLKSFDFRVLNLLLYELSNQRVNEMHMEFLSVSELLVEISDDLFDYEEDVLNNSFNILRMFVRIYGPAEAPYMLAQVIAEAEEEYRQLFKNLEPSLALNYQKRCQEAVIEGGGSSSLICPMGSWTIPALILDEQIYREQVRHRGAELCNLLAHV